MAAEFTRSPLGVSLAESRSPNSGQLCSPFCAESFILSTFSGKLEMKSSQLELFHVTEKRNWPESKRESSSSDQIDFQFFILVSSSMSPLPELGLHPAVGSIFDSLFSRQLKTERESVQAVGATALPALSLGACWMLLAPLS